MEDTMTRHHDEEFDGRRRQDRGAAQGLERGGYARDDSERRMRMDDRRYEDEPWASRDTGQQRRFAERDEPWNGWPPRGDYGQGGYWQSEGARRGQGGFGLGSSYAPDRPDDSPWEFGGYGRERGSIPGPQWRSGQHTGRGPKGYQRSDERIREDICERLTQHGDIDARDIEVKVAGREITLTGTVPDRPAKRMAEDLAEAVSGVTDVHNQLRVNQDARPGHQTPGHADARTGREGHQRVA
jgi:hypothetical protein